MATKATNPDDAECYPIVWGRKVKPSRPEKWYEDFGWYTSTRHYGDLPLQVIPARVIKKGAKAADAHLRREWPKLKSYEREDIVERATTIWDAAEGIYDWLCDATDAYQRRDVDALIEALRNADSLESDFGARPALLHWLEQVVRKAYWPMWCGMHAFFEDLRSGEESEDAT